MHDPLELREHITLAISNAQDEHTRKDFALEKDIAWMCYAYYNFLEHGDTILLYEQLSKQDNAQVAKHFTHALNYMRAHALHTV